jgi:hypothetical protein
LANKPPFGNYQVGDFLGINTELVRWYSFADSYVWDDKDVVSKVVAKPPQFYNKKTFSSDEFGDGWVEE